MTENRPPPFPDPDCVIYRGKLCLRSCEYGIAGPCARVPVPIEDQRPDQDVAGFAAE